MMLVRPEANPGLRLDFFGVDLQNLKTYEIMIKRRMLVTTDIISDLNKGLDHINALQVDFYSNLKVNSA